MDYFAGPFEGSRGLSADCVGVAVAPSRRGAVREVVALVGAPDDWPSEGVPQARLLFVCAAPSAEVGFRLVLVVSLEPPLRV